MRAWCPSLTSIVQRYVLALILFDGKSRQGSASLRLRDAPLLNDHEPQRHQQLALDRVALRLKDVEIVFASRALAELDKGATVQNRGMMAPTVR